MPLSSNSRGARQATPANVHPPWPREFKTSNPSLRVFVVHWKSIVYRLRHTFIEDVASRMDSDPLFRGEIDRLLESENETNSAPISEVTESTPLQDSTLLHESIVETPPEVPVSERVQRRAWIETVRQEGESLDYVEVNEKIRFIAADIQEEIGHRQSAITIP